MFSSVKIAKRIIKVMGFRYYMRYHVFASFPLWVRRIFWAIEKPYDIVRYGFIENKRPWMVNTHLPWSAWHDADRRMLYAIMSVFEQYYENEHTDQRADVYTEECGPKEFWDAYKVSRDVFDKEVEEIHVWWLKHEMIYPLKDDIDDDAVIKEEEEMLIRLMKIRNRLWT